MLQLVVTLIEAVSDMMNSQLVTVYLGQIKLNYKSIVTYPVIMVDGVMCVTGNTWPCV